MKFADILDLLVKKGGANGGDLAGSDAWVTLGSRMLVALLVALFGFGMLISINGAIVSSGVVTVESSYKTVQHLDGGIVAKIQVRNGDFVNAGDTLLELDKTSDRAELTVVTERIDDLLIQRERLEAERDGRDAFAVPAAVTVSPGIQKTIETQQALFNARMETQRGELSVLTGRIEQTTAQLNGLIAQQESRTRERSLMNTDLAGVRELYRKGFANQQRLTQLEREAARLDGEVGRLAGEIARAEGAISETRLNLSQRKKTLIEGVIDELRQVQTSLNELEERRKAISAKVDRAVVRAPQAGRVHALAINTEGGVITPARPILQIIPQNERLIVEARIQPQDIDNVRAGQAAGIRFPTFNARVTPRLEGAVTRVSAAEITNENGPSYFTAQIEISTAELAKIGSNQRLLPGMPAEVFITTEERSILSYFLRPLTDAMFRAFREE